LKFIVLQSLDGKTVTERNIRNFLLANPIKKTNKSTMDKKREGLRQEVGRLGILVDEYYDSPDSATAIVTISIPPAGLVLLCYKRLTQQKGQHGSC
jgi:hypothetical protein